MNPFSAVVLTGGSSVRMGTDKAFVEVAGEPLAHRVFDGLSAAGAERILAVGGDLPRLAALGFEVIDDLYPGEGPLGAVLSGLSWLRPHQLAFVMACDQPAVPPQLPASLVSRLMAEDPSSGTQALVPRVDGEPQPLGALYRVSGRVSLSRSFDGGERSLRRALDGLIVRWIDDLEPGWFIDLDTPAEVDQYLPALDHYAAPDGNS